MCRDYNPRQIECGMGLLSIYYSLRVMDKAIIEFDKLLKTKFENRVMMNHYKIWDCELPKHALRMFAVKQEVLTENKLENAKYAALLHLVVHGTKCQNYGVVFSSEEEDLFNQILKLNDISKNSYTQESLCEDKDLTSYLISNSFELHPCQSIRNQMITMDLCLPFQLEHPPLHDNDQVRTAGSYYGLASIYDIVHQVYFGDYSKLISQKPYKVLFAQYFNPKSLYSFLSKLEKVGVKNFEITALILDQNIMDTIVNNLLICTKKVNVVLKIMTLDKYIVEEETNKYGYFDYIEYNGGLNYSPAYRNHLKYLKLFLSNKGVVGLTAFAKNSVVENIRSMLYTRDVSSHIPFSETGDRFVKDYLRLVGYPFASEDEDLVKFLSGSRPYISKSELLQDVEDSGLTPISWVPTSLSNPYEILDDYSFQIFNSYGIQQDLLIENVIVPFRHSVYLSRSDSDVELGMAKLSLDNLNLAGDSILIDRSSKPNLGTIFDSTTVRNLAMKDIPLEINFQTGLHKLPVTYLCPADILPSLYKLSNQPSINSLLEYNLKTLSGMGSFSMENSKRNMVSLLNFLFKINYLSIWSSVPLDLKGN